MAPQRRWLSRRPVTAEIVGSIPIGVASAHYNQGAHEGIFLLCFEICFPVKKQSKVKVGYGWFISSPVKKDNKRFWNSYRNEPCDAADVGIHECVIWRIVGIGRQGSLKNFCLWRESSSLSSSTSLKMGRVGKNITHNFYISMKEYERWLFYASKIHKRMA